MLLELKKAIIDYMLVNTNKFNLVNGTKNEFRQYVYKEDGNYCIGGEPVAKFIEQFEKLLIN